MDKNKMIGCSSDESGETIKTKHIQWLTLLLCLVIIFEAVIIFRLTDINHEIKQINSNLAVAHHEDTKDSRDFRYIDHELFTLMQTKLRKFSGADYFKNKNVLDPSVLISAEEFKLQLLKENQENKNRLKK